MEKENKFIGYEYKDIKIKVEREALWVDGYKNFGWKLEKSRPAIVKHVWGPIRIMVAPLAIFPGSPFSKMVCDHKSESKVELTLKRDKEMQRKSEINDLQLQFENSAKEIDRLDKSKSTVASVTSYVMGGIGTIFMTGSVFAYLSGMIQLSVVLAGPGFGGWILSYLIYNIIKWSMTKKADQLIEKQYEDIYEICKKANTLIY